MITNCYLNSCIKSDIQNSLLCCVAAPDQEEPQFSSHLEARPARDRVENAFKTFDLDQDGYLNWHEFKQVGHF